MDCRSNAGNAGSGPPRGHARPPRHRSRYTPLRPRFYICFAANFASRDHCRHAPNYIQKNISHSRRSVCIRIYLASGTCAPASPPLPLHYGNSVFINSQTRPFHASEGGRRDALRCFLSRPLFASQQILLPKTAAGTLQIVFQTMFLSSDVLFAPQKISPRGHASPPRDRCRYILLKPTLEAFSPLKPIRKIQPFDAPRLAFDFF